jgi:hypothetical protein
MFHEIISLDTVVKINGIYDILCALSILGIIRVPILDNLHLSMFINPLDDRFSRFFCTLGFYLWWNSFIWGTTNCRLFLLFRGICLFE